MALGFEVNKIIKRLEPELDEHFKSNLGIDIKKTISENPWSITKFDENFTAPSFGFKDRNDMYDKSSAHHRLPNVKIPTLIVNSKDDPILGTDTYKSVLDIIDQNENIILGLTKHGGHIGFFESMLDLSNSWMY